MNYLSRRHTFAILFLACTALPSCGSQQDAKIVYEEDAHSADDAKPNPISAEDAAKLRAWQAGTTTGNAYWSMIKF